MYRYRQAANFLLNTDSTAPILFFSPNQRRLYYASDFRLSYNWEGSKKYDPQPRIIDYFSNEAFDEKVYLVYEDIDNRKREDFISPVWQEVARFGLDHERWRIIVFQQAGPD